MQKPKLNQKCYLQCKYKTTVAVFPKNHSLDLVTVVKGTLTLLDVLLSPCLVYVSVPCCEEELYEYLTACVYGIIKDEMC